MNEYLDPMFPDNDHLRHFPDDAHSDRREERIFRPRPSVLGEARPGAYALAVAIGIVLACVIAFCSGCGVARRCAKDKDGRLNTPCVLDEEAVARDERKNAEARAEARKRLEELHKGFDKAARGYRTP